VASVSGQDGAGGGQEIVHGPSQDPVPEAVHASEHSVVWGEGVGSVGKYGRRWLLPMWLQRKGLTPAPREERRLTMGKMARANESLCL